jgi:hypothetical protein
LLGYITLAVAISFGVIGVVTGSVAVAAATTAVGIVTQSSTMLLTSFLSMIAAAAGNLTGTVALKSSFSWNLSLLVALFVSIIGSIQGFYIAHVFLEKIINFH